MLSLGITRSDFDFPFYYAKNFESVCSMAIEENAVKTLLHKCHRQVAK